MSLQQRKDMDMAHDHSKMSGLTDDFNKSSIGSFIGHAAKHVAIMGLFMAFPMVASAMPIDGATAMDVLVQTGHAMMNMVEGVFDYGLPVMDSVLDNAMQGNFAPSTWGAGSMHGLSGIHAMPGGALMTNVHGANASAAAASLGSGLQVFSTPMEWFQSLPLLNQAQMVDDAQAFGIPFDQYITDWCNNNHVPFGQTLSPH